MYRGNKHLLGDLHKLRESISKKFKAFKEGNVETQLQLTKQYKPLIKQLKKNNTASSQLSIIKKEEPSDDVKDEGEDPHLEGNFQGVDDDSEKEGEDRSVDTFIKESYTDPLIQNYMMGVFRNSRHADHVFGPRFEVDQLMIGDGLLVFKPDGSFTIGNTEYVKPTRGLLDLMFRTDPKGYSDKDLKVYKKILESTNAHRKEYRKDKPINSSRSKKYTSVISSLFSTKKPIAGTPKLGNGLLTKRLVKSTLTYWDDPNELIERLRLLEASRLAGNTGVKNEIYSIIEELKEAGYILGRGNARYRSLLQ